MTTTMHEEYTVLELKAMPTLNSGHFANLKVDTGTVRYWLTRCSQEDGEKHPISVEVLEDGCWKTVHEYGDWAEWYAEEEPEEEEADEPQEDDYTTEDHVHFYQNGRMVFEVPVLRRFGREVKDRDGPVRVNMERALKKHFKSIGFFPNVWWISDHGNAHRIKL